MPTPIKPPFESMVLYLTREAARRNTPIHEFVKELCSLLDREQRLAVEWARADQGLGSSSLEG